MPRSVTYSSPVANKSMILIFFLSGICSFQTEREGRARMMRSDMMLNRHVNNIPISLLRHLYSVTSGFQIRSRGLQANVVMQVLMI